MSANKFQIPKAIISQLCDKLKANKHTELAEAIGTQHPAELGAAEKTQMGGGCLAYRVTVTWNDASVLILWTDKHGMDLPTHENYMIGVYLGEVSEDDLAIIESP